MLPPGIVDSQQHFDYSNGESAHIYDFIEIIRINS